MTVGRATVSDATSAQSVNIVSGAQPLVLPQNTLADYMSAIPRVTANRAQSGSGFALDTPGAGTFYYQIWLSSSSSHVYTGMTAVLTVLKIIP